MPQPRVSTTDVALNYLECNTRHGRRCRCKTKDCFVRRKESAASDGLARMSFSKIGSVAAAIFLYSAARSASVSRNHTSAGSA